MVAVLSACACSEGSDDSHDGGVVAGSSGAGSAGAASGGRAGGSGDGGASARAGASSAGANGAGPLACTPGFTAGAATLYPFPFANCGDIPGLEAEHRSFRDVSLPNPVGPGDTYAFSAEMKTAAGTYLLYGATEKCGGVGELLDTVEVENGDVVLCHQVSPVTGTYTHRIWVWSVAAQQGDTTFCEGGACPGR